MADDGNDEVFVDTSGTAFQVDYEPTRSIENYQTYIVRFGHTNNLTAIFDADVDQQAAAEDYVMGLIFVGAVILGFFLLWGLILMLFMCIGRRIGFLSGAPFVRKISASNSASAKAPGKSKSKDSPSHSYDEGEYNEVQLDGELRNSPAHQFDADREVSTSNYNQSPSSQPFQPRRTSMIAYVASRNGDGWKSRATISRLIFILAGIICITFGLLLVTMGVTNLQTSVNTIDARAHDLHELSASTVVLIKKGMRDLTTSAGTVRSILVDDMGTDEAFCPGNAEFIGDSRVGRDLREQRDRVIEVLDELDNFQEDILQQLESAMEDIADGSRDFTDESSDVDINDWQSLVVIIPYTVLPSLLIVAAVLALFDVSSRIYSCVINWCILPLFIVMTILAAILAASMAITAGVNSDFCLPGGEGDASPDDLILNVITAQNYDSESLPYKVANFYISQCSITVEDPWREIRRYQPQLDESSDSLETLLANVTDSNVIDELAVYCNRNFDILEPLLSEMNGIVKILRNTVVALLDVARCGRLIPLYTDTTYKAGCEYTPRAVFWVFYSCLILTFFGMVMITLRSAMKMSTIDDEDVHPFIEARTNSLSMNHHQSPEHDGDANDEYAPNEDGGNSVVSYSYSVNRNQDATGGGTSVASYSVNNNQNNDSYESE